MKSYYTIQTSEDTSVRIPMVQSLGPAEALLLGAIISSKNQSISELIEKRGELLLGCLMGTLIEGSESQLDSQESLALSKMLVSDIANLIFKTFESLEESLEAAEAEQEEATEPEATEESDEAQEPYDAIVESLAAQALENLTTSPSEDDN
jgi:hypothetical protein